MSESLVRDEWVGSDGGSSGPWVDMNGSLVSVGNGTVSVMGNGNGNVSPWVGIDDMVAFGRRSVASVASGLLISVGPWLVMSLRLTAGAVGWCRCLGVASVASGLGPFVTPSLFMRSGGVGMLSGST